MQANPPPRTRSKDRFIIATMVGLASTIALALIAFVFVSEFPAPSPEGGDLLRR